eukprot:3426852-Rhodomonas_salina.5
MSGFYSSPVCVLDFRSYAPVPAYCTHMACSPYLPCALIPTSRMPPYLPTHITYGALYAYCTHIASAPLSA